LSFLSLEVLLCKGSAGGGLKLFFKAICFFMIRKRDVSDQFPRHEIVCVDRLTGVVIVHAALEIKSHTDLVTFRMRVALDHVDIFHEETMVSGYGGRD
jgi:hypothetical protein